MPILELFPKPARSSDQPENRNSTGAAPPPKQGGRIPGAASSTLVATAVDPASVDAPVHSPNRQLHAVKVRTGRYGELEEHELIHLLDTLDDERSRARFRESIYISVIFYLALAWFLFYGPRILFHQPQYRDPIAVMKQHDQELTLNLPKERMAKPPTRPLIDRKTMQQLKQQAPPTPQPPAPQAPQPQQAQPQQEARNAPPPVAQPQAPLPVAPRPAQPAVSTVPEAPRPNFAQNNQSARDAIQNATRNALNGRSGAEVGSGPSSNNPLGAGAQILSDTQGVDFSAYIRKMLGDTKRNWIPLIPEEAEPPISKKGITWIRFKVLPGGEIGAMTLETPSGDVALDRAAWGAITSEGAYPPLPREFHGPYLELRLGFYCNTALPN